MNERISLYREILEQDPRSRVFFDLAGLLHAGGLHEEAASVLQKGLQWHPDFLEARFLLVRVLLAGGDDGRKLAAEMNPVVGTLARYPDIFEVWAWAAGERETALPSALRLLATLLRHPEARLETLLELGLDALETRASESSASPDPSRPSTEEGTAPGASAMPDSDPFPSVPSSSAGLWSVSGRQDVCSGSSETYSGSSESLSASRSPAPVSGCPLSGEISGRDDRTFPGDAAAAATDSASSSRSGQDRAGVRLEGTIALDVFGPAQSDDGPEAADFPSFRTRSMANILAEQGDFVGALEIYRELEGRTSDREEKRALKDCIRLLEQRMGSCASADEPEEDGEAAFQADVPDSVELNDLLESLADRLEARARSGAPVTSGEA